MKVTMCTYISEMVLTLDQLVALTVFFFGNPVWVTTYLSGNPFPLI